MKNNTCPLYPNLQVGTKVTEYSYEHSTKLPQNVLDYHAWGSNHERSSYMISPFQSQFQMWLSKALGVKRVLEIGCFIGYSAMTWAEAVGSDGFVTTLELSDEYANIAKEAWEKNNYKNIEVLVGSASDSLKKLSESGAEPYDLVFIDADKSGYPGYLETILSHSQPGSSHRLLRPGGFIIADNILRRGLIADSSEANPNAAPLFDQETKKLWKSTDMIEIQRFNEMMVTNARLETFLLPLFDGLSMAKLQD